MKIDSTKNSPLASTQLKNLRELEKQNAHNEEPAESSSRARSAQIEMSHEALTLKKAKALANPNGIDEAKVARLQRLIDEGKYKVDANDVADRLVDEHLKME